MDATRSVGPTKTFSRLASNDPGVMDPSRDKDWIQAPYISFMDYQRKPHTSDSHSGYNQFPIRYLQDILETSSTAIPLEIALSSLIQTWLLFGTLSEFFQRDIKGEFLDSGSRKIIFQPVKTVQALFKDIDNTIVAKRSRINLLARAAYATNQLDQVNLLISRDMPYIQLSLFLVKVILADLAHEQKLRLKTRDQKHTYNDTLDAILDSESIVKVRPWLSKASFSNKLPCFDIMVAQGWCPLQMAELATIYDASSIYKLARIPRLDPPGQTNLIESLKHDGIFKHQDCYALSDCRLNNTSNKSYHFQHHSVCHGSCASIGLDETNTLKMESLLQARKMPVVKCVLESDGVINLSIIEAQFTLSYIAISHVWADGLGNPNEHTLPRCQMVKIVEALLSIKSSWRSWSLFSKPSSQTQVIYFWMDVFCVPKLPVVDHPTYAKKYALLITALEMMSPTYALAKAVLVLDSELRSRTLDSPVATTPALFVSCRWMSRCWTLQEGALASESSLCYQIGTEIKNHKELLKHFSSDSSFLKDLPFIASNDTGATVDMNTGRIRQFRRVWDSFRGRTTSKPEDAYIILANLLDFSINSLLEIKGTDSADLPGGSTNIRARMGAMILSQEYIPIDFMCADNSETPHGLDWIPRQPGKPVLAPMNFTRYMKVHDGYMILDDGPGPRGFLIPSIHETPTQFVFSLPLPWAPAHVNVTLASNRSLTTLQGIYIFLQLPNRCHPLAADWCGKGACFSILENDNHLVIVQYICSIQFRVCWCRDTHTMQLQDRILAEENHHRIVVVLAESEKPIQKLRRRYFNMRGISRIARLYGFILLASALFIVIVMITAESTVFSVLVIILVLLACLAFLASYFWRAMFLLDVKRSMQTNFLWLTVKFSLAVSIGLWTLQHKMRLFFTKFSRTISGYASAAWLPARSTKNYEEVDQELHTMMKGDWSRCQEILGNEITDTIKNIAQALERAVDH